MDPDVQTPFESSSTPIPCNSKSVKKAVPTLEFQTVGSDMIGHVSSWFVSYFYRTTDMNGLTF